MDFDHIEASQGFDSSAQSINKLLKGSTHKKFPEDSAGEEVQANFVESNKSGIAEDELGVLEREPGSTSNGDDTIRKSEQNDVVVASISCGVEGDEKVLENCDNKLPLIEYEVNVEFEGPTAGSQMVSRHAIDMDVDTGDTITTVELPCHSLENLQSVSEKENTFKHDRATKGDASTKTDSVDVPSGLELRKSSESPQDNRKEFQQNVDDQLSQLSDKGEAQASDSEAANARETVHGEGESVKAELNYGKDESVDTESRTESSFHKEYRKDGTETDCREEARFREECRKKECVETERGKGECFEAACSKDVNSEVECSNDESVENECRKNASFEAESRNDRNTEIECSKDLNSQVECSNDESVENEGREGATFKAKRTKDESSDVEAKRRKEETAGATLDTNNSLTSLPLEEFVVIDVYEGESLAREICPKIEKKKTTRRRPSFLHRMLRRRKARNKARDVFKESSECLCERKAGERITNEKIEDERITDEKIEDERIEDESIAEERIEDERVEEERVEEERIEDERVEEERIEEERIEDERVEEERIEDERVEEERIEDERVEEERIEDEGIEDERVEEELFEDESISEERTADLSTQVDLFTQVKSVDQGNHFEESFPSEKDSFLSLDKNVFMKEMVESVGRELQLTFDGQESESESQIANEMESNNTSNGLLEQKNSNKYTVAKTELDRSLELEDVENGDLLEGDGHSGHSFAQPQSCSKVVGPCEVEKKIELQNRISTVSFGSSGCPDQTTDYNNCSHHSVLDQSRGDAQARSSTQAQNTSIEHNDSQRVHLCSPEKNGERLSFSDGDAVGSPEIQVQAGKSKGADDAENGSAPADVSRDLVGRSFVFRPSDGFIVKKRNFAKRSASNASHGSSHDASPLPTVEASSSKMSSRKNDQVMSHGQSETGASAAQKEVDKDKGKPHNNDLVKASFLYLAGMKSKMRQPFDLSIFSRFHPKTS